MMLAPNSKYHGRSNITRTATAYYQYKNFLEALNGMMRTVSSADGAGKSFLITLR